MTDLFLSSKDRLWNFIKKKGYAKTSEVIRFASDNLSNRGDRDARQLAKEGRIRRMPEDRKIRLFGPIKQDVWEVIVWTSLPVTQINPQMRWRNE